LKGEYSYKNDKFEIRLNKNEFTSTSISNSKDVDNSGIYLGEIVNKKVNDKYVGHLNKKLLRKGFGKYTYPNGDVYIGEWANNKKEGTGILVHNDEEIYCGKWRDGYRDEVGMYFWKNADSDRKDVFLGKVSKDQLKEGVYISKSSDSNTFNDLDNGLVNYIYYGEFNNDGTKSDKEGFLYDVDRTFLFYGELKNNKIESGYQIFFDTEMKKFTNIVHFTMSPTENKIIEIKKAAVLKDSEKNKIFGQAEKFLSTFAVGEEEDNLNSRVKEVFNSLSMSVEEDLDFENFNQNWENVQILLNERIMQIEKEYSLP
jgi:hypothetical protein